MENIIGGVKADLDRWWLALQSYFDKEKIIIKMVELNTYMLQRVEVIGCMSSCALQACPKHQGPEVMVGGLGSVSSAITLV